MYSAQCTTMPTDDYTVEVALVILTNQRVQHFVPDLIMSSAIG